MNKNSMTAYRNIFQNMWLYAFVLIFLFVGAYWIPLKGIVNTWITNEDYSYGFLIPVVSVYLLWDMRSRLKGLEIKSAWSVLPVLLLFVFLSLYGILGSSGHISRPAVPILIMLFTAFCFGRAVIKQLILPMGFLIFMIPLPSVLDRTFGVFLKGISSELGGVMIRLVGIPVFVRGNVIDLGVTQLQVVDACSGLRFVFPLLALGVIYAYFFEKVMWKRIFCVVATIPIAIITNVVRIGITGILTTAYGSKVAEGFFHGFSGWAIFMVAFAFLFGLGLILRLFPPKVSSTKKTSDMPVPEVIEEKLIGTNEKNTGAFLVSILLLLIVGGFSWTTSALPPVKIQGGIESFPLTFGNWQGRARSIDPEITEKSGAEEAFEGVYSNSEGDTVSLYIGYRSTAFLENENFFHSPTVCLPGAGWETKRRSTRTITDVPRFGNVTVAEMIVEFMGERQVVYFWFQTEDKATHDKNINRFHLALHAIKQDNTYDLFIRPITLIKRNETIQDAEARMDGFVRDMMQALLDFLAERQVASS